MTICKAIYRYYKLHKIPLQVSSNTSNTESPSSSMSNYAPQQDEVDDYEAEILGNPILLKVGCEPSDGSDS